MDKVAAAQVELNELDKDIVNIGEQIKELQAKQIGLRERHTQLRQFLSLASSLFGGVSNSVAWTKPHQGPGPLQRMLEEQGNAIEATRREPQSKRIADIAEELITLAGPIPTRELLSLLQQRGEVLGGANPLVSLSVIMSRDKRFKSDRTKGWSLDDGLDIEKGSEGASTPNEP